MDSTAAVVSRADHPGPAMTLDAWLTAHGPMLPAAALVLGLHLCARASRMSDGELSAAMPSLNTAGIVRQPGDGWSWSPATARSARYLVTDADVLAHIGAVLFHALTGRPLAEAFPTVGAVRNGLRTLRPDLPTPLTDLIVEAVTARRGSSRRLQAFAQDLRLALGVERQPGIKRETRVIALAGAIVAVLGMSVASPFVGGRDESIDAHGLTRHESVLLDVLQEAAQTYALIDEHTVGIQQFQALAELWRARIPLDDPRLAWVLAHEAWVRTLAGDRLTTEQLFDSVEGWLANQLGEGHPYTRAVRLGLATTVEARGVSEPASTARDRAERAVRALFDGTGLEPDLLDGIPAPPGVQAHVAPAPAILEGFRKGSDGSFFVPLTSSQRWRAARDGWRLHLVATDWCRVALAAGSEPRLVSVTAAPSGAGAWEVRVAGTTPPLTLHRTGDATAGVSLRGDPTGALQVTFGDHAPVATRLDTAAPPAAPPHTLAFDEGRVAGACRVVWLEIPMPMAPQP